MLHDILKLAKSVGITSREDIQRFCDIYGELETERILRRIRGLQEQRRDEGLAPIKPLSQFRQFARTYASQKKAEEVRATREAEWREIKQNAKRAKDGGYVPTREKIKEQLDTLIDQGKISTQQYEWGIKGLALVHGMMGIKSEEPEQFPPRKDGL